MGLDNSGLPRYRGDIPIYIFAWKGRWIREHSKFAQSLIEKKEGSDEDNQEEGEQEA